MVFPVDHRAGANRGLETQPTLADPVRVFCLDRFPVAGIAENRESRCRLTHGRLTPMVAKARWVMVAAIAFSTLLTLLGQPESFWRDPATAIRGDGLSIHATTNHTFEFFLGHGAPLFLVANLLYMATALFVVSRLPRTLALIAIVTAIFAHGYGATNWLVVRFHFGLGGGITTCAILLGVLLSFAVLPTSTQPRAVINAWRWLMVAMLFVDATNTLLGQPASYWRNPVTVHEGNALSHFLLSHGWIYYLGYDLVEAAGKLVLVAILPVPAAFVCVFAFTFGNFIGASNWFFYVWRLGWGAVVAHALVLSTLMVLLAFRDSKAKQFR